MINAVSPLRECELFRCLEEEELARVAIIPFRFDYTAISLANRSGLPLSRE